MGKFLVSVFWGVVCFFGIPSLLGIMTGMIIGFGCFFGLNVVALLNGVLSDGSNINLIWWFLCFQMACGLWGFMMGMAGKLPGTRGKTIVSRE